MPHLISDVSKPASLAVETTAANVHKTLRVLLDRLESFRPFEPVPELMSLYREFFSLALHTLSPSEEQQLFADVQIQEIIPRMRAVWGDARGCLEEHWASYITESATIEEARSRFESYPNLDNYKLICPTEIALMTATLGRAPRSIAYIGSGPLPITTMNYVDHFDRQDQRIDVLNIDICAERIEASKRLLARLDRQGSMKFQVANGRVPNDELGYYDVVVLASVCGVSEADKVAMLASAAKVMSANAVILTRASTGMGRLFYPSMDLESLAEANPSIQPVLKVELLEGPVTAYSYAMRIKAEAQVKG